ncbi:AMIN domain-containing protein [candidate division WOR-3 bacterium]|nr:AMIN domain-containing protein [candidate division WOR-3 bacterium]
MTKRTIALLTILGLSAVLTAQETINVTDVAIDKLLDGVRVTIACDGDPNVSSFVTAQPPAVVVDLMGATSRVAAEQLESKYYPVAGVTVKASEATSGVRVTIRLRELTEHRVTTEKGLVVIDVSTVPVVSMPAAEPPDQFAGKRLTIYVKDAEVTDVLRMLASQFNLNILTTQDVKSVVTVRLSDVPLRVGLEALVKAAIANIVEDRNGILIVKPLKKEMFGETQTRLFRLDYVEATDIVKVMRRVLSPAGEVIAADRRLASGGGSERTAYIVVSDIPEALEAAAAFIAEYDRPIPQIMIEAKFVETTQTDEDRFGIQWTLAANASAGPFNSEKDFGVPIVTPRLPEEVPSWLNPGPNLVLGKVSLDRLNASMEIMASRGRSRVIASPKTMTLDNQTATMTTATDFPVREISSDPKTGLVITTWRSRSVPVKLEVTPRVTSDGRITMNVKPTVEAITGYVGPADDQRPVVARRSAETQVTVADGEVAVIGGLLKDEETRNVGKIPLLGDIPLLGHLFKKTSIRHDKSELVIFIIPHIVPAGG